MEEMHSQPVMKCDYVDPEITVLGSVEELTAFFLAHDLDGALGRLF